jgi:hypothetical protein
MTLRQLASSLIDLPYLFSRLTYADELTIHFGEERKHNHPKLADKVRGTHVLSLRGSAWLLRSGVKSIVIGSGVSSLMGTGDVVSKYNLTALESGALIEPKATVLKATPTVVEPLNSIGLTLELSDGSMFLVLPTAPEAVDADDLPEPADWELLTPSKLFRVGPRANMEIIPS